MDSSINEQDLISESSVINLLEELLPLLSSGPYSLTTLSMLAELCSGLKVVGSQLDLVYKDKMDKLQSLLTKVCQDSSLDLILRLQVLEIIELRTLAWKSNEGVDTYYKERFAQFEESKRKKVERKQIKSKEGQSKDGLDKKQRLSKISKTLSSNTQEPSGLQKLNLLLNGIKLELSSVNVELISSAKIFLENHFSTQPCMPSKSSSIKYSRTDLLTLSSSPMAKEAPKHWDRLLKTIPTVVQKSGSSARLMVEGGGNIVNMDGGKVREVSDFQIIRNLA